MAFSTDNVHVWRSLLEQAGFTLADIPKQWEAFWSFWCDRVQPAIRKARGRDDIYGVGLAMSAEAPGDTRARFEQFRQAYEANYVTREGKLVIDDPEIRRRLIRAMDSYTAIYRKGCTPPDAVGWDDFGNNQAFLAQTVAMTVNETLSIPNALKAKRPEDYYKNTATIEWPEGADGQPLAIQTGYFAAVAFKAGGHVPLAKEFVGFLVAEGWLAHYLDFSGERLPAVDAEAARPAVLARPERSAPHGRGDAIPDPPAHHNYRGRLAAIGGTSWSRGRRSGARPSTASPPRASAPSRRSTRRSPASSRSWRSDGTSKARPSTHLRSGAKPSFSALFGLQGALQRTLWDGIADLCLGGSPDCWGRH